MKVWAISVLAASLSISSSCRAWAADTPVAAPVAPTQPAAIVPQAGTAPLQQGSTSVNVQTESEAEKWVAHRNEPLWQQQAEEQKAKKKPMKNLMKSLKANYKEE